MPYPDDLVNPASIAGITELQRLYATLRDLDARIAAGRGNQTVAELREELLARYLALLPDSSSLQGAAQTTPAAPVTMPPVIQGPAIAPPVIVAPPAPLAPSVRPPRPAFSWQAFLAEQAIAIMAYMGGFLLLVATLTFEVGAWQVLPDIIKLIVVCAVYLVFGGLGFALRRSTRLRTVGRAYLGVFALMTPLVVLAAYRFQFQATGFPPSGMLCVGALYAAAVYLVLAHRTRFATYAYLGGVALVVAALAVIPWSGIDLTWWPFALAVVGLVLLLPRWVKRFGIAEALGQPAMQVSALASAAAILGVESLGAVAFTTRGTQVTSSCAVSVDAISASACVLVPLAAGWGLIIRRLASRFGPAAVDIIDAASTAIIAQACLAIALWLGAQSPQFAYVMAALALAEQAGASALRQLRPDRVRLRYGIEGIALALVTFAALLVLADSAPNWPLAAALTVGLLVTLSIAVTENAPWWLLASGFALTVDYQVLGTALLPSSHLAHDSSGLYAALTLAVWATALGLGLRANLSRFAAPVYAVALGDAVYTSILLVLHPDAVYQTAILLVFMVAAFIAARREQQELIGGIVIGTLGVMATVPFALNDANSWHEIMLALAFAAAALAVRRVYGRFSALPLYASSLVAAVLATWQTGAPGTSTAGLAPLGVPLAAYLLLVFAALTYGVALWEGVPWAMTIPAVFALWAVAAIGHHPANLGFVFVIAAAGAAARRWRGRWWGIALHVAAALGSVLVISGLQDYGAAAPYWQVPLLLAYAVAAYLVALQERQWWITAAATLYVLTATWLLPTPGGFIATLALTFGLAALGLALSRKLGRPWSWAPYAAAVGASLFAIARVTPFDPGQVEALLLVFAATAYVVAALEANSLAAGAAALYAFAAVLVQPDARALLPLALGLAIGGMVIGRLAGIRWSYPFYAAAVLAAITTTVVGQSDTSFEALALLALAVVAYAIAAIESRPEVLAAALALAVAALAVESGVLRLQTWQTTLAFAALGWAYALLRIPWQILPGLRAHGVAWWTNTIQDPERKAQWTDPRYVGVQIHRWGAILVSGGTVVAALLAPDAYAAHSAQTQMVAVALIAFAGMLGLLSRDLSFRLGLYAAGELVALAITWEAIWLGANNVQAFVLAPGTYQLLIGALMPADKRIPSPERLSQGASVLGALFLLLPTLLQSLQTEPAWLYALILTVEALVIAGVGVGTHSRILVMVGSGFVGLAAIRGAILAVQSGLPIPLVIALLAILLMGGATWLSLRSRRNVPHVP